MRTIWKFPLLDQPVQIVQMPKEAWTCSLDVQDGILILWAMVEDSEPLVEQTVWITGTGWDMGHIPVEALFVGTVQIDSYVWHVFVKNSYA